MVRTILCLLAPDSEDVIYVSRSVRALMGLQSRGIIETSMDILWTKGEP